MPVVETTTKLAVTKAVASGGAGVALATLIDLEFIIIMSAGIFASASSYFYDWVHRAERKADLKALSELIKYNFYGVIVMFVVYFIGLNHGSEYVNLPPIVWGMISALCAGNAVTLIDWTILFAKRVAEKKGGV